VKIFSEKTNKEYASVEACLADEADYDKKIAERESKKEKEVAERKAAAAKVEEKRQALCEAQKAYHEELNKFCQKYGAYHYTLKTDGDSLFNLLFEDFWS